MSDVSRTIQTTQTKGNNMKARPILMNGDMVLAVLDGRKTQTRRVVPERLIEKWFDFDDYVSAVAPRDIPCSSPTEKEFYMRRCPFGRPGDLLYVRETFARVPSTAYRMSNGVQQTEDPNSLGMCAIYKQGWERSTGGFSWTPSIHMPRWASRITLEITDVRVERLQDISEEDAQAEGCYYEGWSPSYSDPDSGGDGCEIFPTGNFAKLWDSIYGTWAANPWVWVVEFKPHMKNVDEVIRDRA